MNSKTSKTSIVTPFVKWSIIVFFTLFVISATFFVAVDYSLQAGRIQLEHITSPEGSTRITLLMERKGDGWNSRHYIYVLPGRYDEKAIPTNGNYLKLGEGRKMDYEWLSENQIRIFSSGEFVSNQFNDKDLSVEFLVDKARFKELMESGVEVRQYNLFGD